MFTSYEISPAVNSKPSRKTVRGSGASDGIAAQRLTVWSFLRAETSHFLRKCVYRTF